MSRTVRTLLIAMALASSAGTRTASADVVADEATSARALPTVSGEEATSLDAMAKFVAINAILAGAAGACQLPVALSIKACTQLELHYWHAASGLAPFRDVGGALKLGSTVWVKFYALGRDKQSSLTPPLACQDVASRAAAAPALSVCGPTGGPGQPVAPAGPQTFRIQ